MIRQTGSLPQTRPTLGGRCLPKNPTESYRTSKLPTTNCPHIYNNNPITQDGWQWEWGSCVLRFPRHLAVSLQALPVHKGCTVTTITDFYINVLPQKVRLKNAWVQITSFPSISILCSIKKEAAQRKCSTRDVLPSTHGHREQQLAPSHWLYPCLSLHFCDLNILTFLTKTF